MLSAQYSRRLASPEIDLGYRLPDADISELIGLLETINDPDYGSGHMDLPELADILSLDIDDLFPLTEVLEVLGFAKVSGGDIELTQAGRDFADADILQRKPLFAASLLASVPIAKYIRTMLDDRPNHEVTREEMLEDLAQHLSDKEATRVLRVVIDWGRYAEIFAYDDNGSLFSLENPN